MRDINELIKLNDHIQTELVEDECDIHLERIGPRTYLKNFPFNPKSSIHLASEKIKKECRVITRFLNQCYSETSKKPSWYKINIIDQAVNEYVGMGFINLEKRFDWLSFILNYLCNDQADQSGDTLFIIFDPDLQWAVCFTLCTDDSYLSIEKFEKQR